MAIRTMKEGEPATISITNPIYAYGIEGVPPFVPCNLRIIIDLEIINIDKGVMTGGGGSTRMQQSLSSGRRCRYCRIRRHARWLLLMLSV